MRSPGSALYGANAFLGVINVVTAKQQNDVSVSRGQHDLLRTALNVSGTTEVGWKNSLFAHVNQAEGETQQRYDPRLSAHVDDQQAEDHYNLYWQSSWNAWTLQMRHAQHANEGGYVLGVAGTEYPNFTKFETSLLALGYEASINDEWMYKGRLYHSPYTTFYRLRLPDQPGASGRQLYSSISLFDTVIEDAVALQNTPPPQLFVNTGQEHFSGLEVGQEWHLNRYFQISMSATHIFNSPFRNNNDSEQWYGLGLLFNRNTLSGSVSAHYFGPREDDNAVPTSDVQVWGGYTVLDAALQLQWSPRLEWSLALRNLGDKQYTLPAQTSPINDRGVPGLSREIELGVKYDFE